MSYIGKNPKADSIKLTGTATAASGTDEGQIYYNTGTGTISEGLKVYKNGNFVGIDKQLGDADTIALKKAVDVGSLQWTVAINSTSTTVGMNNPIPQYDAASTGFENASSTFSNSSTGNALLTDESADLVFAYESHTVNSKNDYFGVQIDIPKAFRGGNLVLSFEYRTAEASAATSDDDFRVSVQDNTTANRGQTTSGTGVTGSQAAGTSILVGSSTNFTVGDRVRVESGTGVQGAQANDFTEAYVTAIADATHLTFSETIVFPSTVGALVAGGWLTDKVPGQLVEADSDTNKVGKKRSIQFKTEETTETVNVTFQNLSTSAAGIDLFVDNILLSANKFLQASSKVKSESARYQTWSAAATSTSYNRAVYYATEIENSISELGTVENSTTQGWSFTANTDVTVTANADFVFGAGGRVVGWSINSTQVGTNIDSITEADVVTKVTSPANNYVVNATAVVKMKKGDVLRPHTGLDAINSASWWTVSIDVVDDGNDVIILESQDEIFTDWVDYTPVTQGFGTPTVTSARWRRVGGNMELAVSLVLGTTTSTEAQVGLPSGYTTDSSLVDKAIIGMVASNSRSDTNIYVIPQPSKTYVIFSMQYSGYYNPTVVINGNAGGIATGQIFRFTATVPIQGWNANFNPLLSMPLADFGTFENTYAAVIAEDGTITSQSGNFIASISKTTGVYTITYTSGFFTVEPAVQATLHTTRDERDIQIDSTNSSATGCEVETYDPGGATPENNGFFLTVSRQGSDYRDPPQPTAAVIKPAVAILKDVKAYNVGGGTNTTGSTTWTPRDLNTIEGESWFVTLADPVFTLEPGSYELEWEAPFLNTQYNLTRLYDVTNSVVTGYGSTGYSDTSSGAQVHSMGKFAITIGASTQYRIEYSCNSNVHTNYGLGLYQGFSAVTVSVYTQVKIRKLK